MPLIINQSFSKKIGSQKLNGYTMSNGMGMEMEILNLGGIIKSLHVPNAKGESIDVALGFPSHEDYLNNEPFFGAIIGRYANRISRGKLPIESKLFQLNTNANGQHLHGGSQGFHNQFWEVEILEDGLLLRHESPHMHENYPGNLVVELSYGLSQTNELIIKYKAKTDQTTAINLTNHSYFNLNGESGTSIDKHQFMINADAVLEIDDKLIPTGKFKDVANSALDLRTLRSISASESYDYNYVLNNWDAKLNYVAQVYSDSSGILLDVKTTEPGIQFYISNFKKDSCLSKSGKFYDARAGFCLECQHFPDSPNQLHFPTTILRAGELFESQTVYQFGFS